MRFRPPANAAFYTEEKEVVASDVYPHVWERAMSGEYARAA